MKKYDVYAVGSAFVDFQFSLSFEEFNILDCEKGGTYLINDAIEKKLNEVIKNKSSQKFCGASGANTLVALNYVGGKGFYSCSIANDLIGNFYHLDLKKNKIDSIYDFTPLREGVTGTCNILLTPDADRTLFTTVGVSDKISKNELYEPAIASSKCVFIEGFLFLSPFSKPLVKQAYEMALSNQCKTVFTLSTAFLSDAEKSELSLLFHKRVDLLFCNEIEAMHFSKSKSIDAALQVLNQLAKNIVITQGAKGAIIFDGSQQFCIPATSTTVIDTTGAGDAFAGGFLGAYSKDMDLKTAGIIANETAAKAISKFGPRV